MFKIWHLLRGITLWTIWIERNDRVFNQEQWHVSRVMHHIWDELIMYAKAACNRVVTLIKFSKFSVEALLQDFDKTWGTMNVLCGCHNLHVEWNWRRQLR